MLAALSLAAFVLAVPALAVEPPDIWISSETEDEAKVLAELEAISPDAVEPFLIADRALLACRTGSCYYSTVVENYDKVIELVPDFDVAIRRKGFMVVSGASHGLASVWPDEQARAQTRMQEGLALLERAVSIRRSTENLGELAFALWMQQRRRPQPDLQELDRALSLAEEALALNARNTHALRAGSEAGNRLAILKGEKAADPGVLRRVLALASTYLDDPGTSLIVSKQAVDSRAIEALSIQVDAAHKLRKWGVLRRAVERLSALGSQEAERAKKLLAESPSGKLTGVLASWHRKLWLRSIWGPLGAVVVGSIALLLAARTMIRRTARARSPQRRTVPPRVWYATAGLLTLVLTAALIGPRIGLAVTRAKQVETMALMKAVSLAVDKYLDRYPRSTLEVNTLDDLERLLVPEVMVRFPRVDAWGNPFDVKAETTQAQIWIISLGADGKPGPRTFTYSSFRGGDDPADDIIAGRGGFFQLPNAMTRIPVKPAAGYLSFEPR